MKISKEEELAKQAYIDNGGCSCFMCSSQNINTGSLFGALSPTMSGMMSISLSVLEMQKEK